MAKTTVEVRALMIDDLTSRVVLSSDGGRVEMLPASAAMILGQGIVNAAGLARSLTALRRLLIHDLGWDDREKIIEAAHKFSRYYVEEQAASEPIEAPKTPRTTLS